MIAIVRRRAASEPTFTFPDTGIRIYRPVTHSFLYPDRVTSMASTLGSGESSRGSRTSFADGREFIVLMVVLMACGAVAIDLLLPAFPDMRREFGMDPDSTQVSWLITAFFLGMAVGPWLYGPASDRYGRRKPLAAGLLLYIAAGIAASFAPTWTWVVVVRFIWGVGAAAPRSLSTAMIRDRYAGNEMARLMSMITAVFLLVPIFAPSIGAGLIAILPWRAVFWFPSVIGVILLIWSRRLPETLDPANQRPFTWRAVGAAGREVLSTRETVVYGIATTFLFGVMTTYLSGSEVIIEDVYGYGPWFPLIFGVIAVVFAINSLNNARLVKVHGIETLVRRIVLVGTGSSVLLLLIAFGGDGQPNFWIFCISVSLLIPIAQGLAPICNTAAMTPVPHIAGTASALLLTVTTAGGSLLGGLGSGAFDGTIRPFALYVVGYFAIATTLILWMTGRGRRGLSSGSAGGKSS